MLRNLRKYEEREERSTTDSKSTLAISSAKHSISCSPSIKLLSFRNFLPAFDPVLIDEYSQYVPEVANYKDLRAEHLKKSRPFGSISPSIHNEGDIILKAFQEGPFLIFTYTESLRSGCCRVLQSLGKLEIDSVNTRHAPIDEESFFHEEDLSVVKLKEDEALYCIPKEQFQARMKSYSVYESSWREQGIASLKEKVENIQRYLSLSRCLEEKDLVLLSCIHKSPIGEFHRVFCKKSKLYYGVRNIRIRSPEMLTIILRELDVLVRILESGSAKEHLTIVSMNIVPHKGTEDVELKIISDIGCGTLEEFSEFQKENKEIWEEEDLVQMTLCLLKQYRIYRDTDVFIRDIRPSNIILRKDSKGFRFLDFSLAMIKASEDENTAFEIIGMPKYMSCETLDIIKKAKLRRCAVSQCDLYAIGAVILSIIPYYKEVDDNSKNKEEIIMSQDRSIEERNRVMQQYPILWEKYLEKLLDSEPNKREEVLVDLQFNGREELVFLKKYSKNFESFLAQKDYGNKKELLEDSEVFLDHFSESKNLKLVDNMQESMIEKFSKGGETPRRAQQFVERVVGFYENEKSVEKLTEVYEKWIKTFDIERTKKRGSIQDSEELNTTLIDYNNKLGSVYQDQGVYNKALQKYERALYLQQVQDKEDPTGNSKAYMKIAEMYERLERYDLAIETYKKAQNKTRECFGVHKNQLQQAILYERMGDVYFKKRDYPEAIKAAKQAIESYTVCYGQYHESVGCCEKLLGDILIKAGSSEEEAFKHYDRYFCIQSYGSKKYDINAAELMEKIGDYYKEKDMLGKAIENYERGLQIFEYHANEEFLYELYEKLSECFGKQKRYMMAINYLRQCLKIKIGKLGEENYQIIPIVQKIANHLVQEGEHKEALSEYSRALSIALVHKPSDEDVLVIELLKNISKISPLAFLSYKNYSKKGDKNTILISLNSLEDVRGVIEGVDFESSLDKFRGVINKECSYFKFFKYEFMVNGKVVEMADERGVRVQECMVLKEGFNHVVIKEDKSLGLKGRFTF